MTLFKDVFVVSGCGVGGGSLGYANTLYRPRDGLGLLPRPAVGASSRTGRPRSRPHYETAERMLGVTHLRGRGPRRHAAARARRRDGRPRDLLDDPRRASSSASPARPSPDPYFGGEGPPRAGCIRCGACMVGCRHNAKNTLPKNYLCFAERAASQILPERTVAEVRPLGAADGSDGYAVTSERSGAWFRKDRQTLTARGVVVAAGPLGTNQLLQRCRIGGALPRLSRAPRLPRAHQLARRSPPSPPRTTATTSRSRSRSPRASIPTPTPTSRTSPTARAPTRSRSSSRSSGRHARAAKRCAGRAPLVRRMPRGRGAR